MSYYDTKNRAGNVLARHLQGYMGKTRIPYLSHTTNVQKVYNPQTIVDAFSGYYHFPYNLQKDPSVPQPSV